MHSYIIHVFINPLSGVFAPFSASSYFFSRETLRPATAPVQIKLTSGTWLIRGRPAWCHGQLAFTARVCAADIVSSPSTDAQTQTADARHAITGGCSPLVSEHRENTSGWQMTAAKSTPSHSWGYQMSYCIFLFSEAPHRIRSFICRLLRQT